MKPKVPGKKKAFLLSLIVLYIALGWLFHSLLQQGVIEQAEPSEGYENTTDVDRMDIGEIRARLEALQGAVRNHLLRDNHHLDLDVLLLNGSVRPLDTNTNSEAVSYYLLWNAEAGNKQEFDAMLDYVQENMLHPLGYMMWRLNANDTVETDGANIASDADLRAINSLFIAEEKWGDAKYSSMIKTLAQGLEKVAISNKTMLAPYGGASGNDTWTGEVVWLSYMNFEAVDKLSRRYGEPWTTLYMNMKNATLAAQRDIGVYDSEINEKGEFGRGMDSKGYSINSMWVMVRAAESNDTELRASAARSLGFYKKKMTLDSELFAVYSINGDPLAPYDTPWTYALVGRAAVALNDTDLSDSTIEKLFEHQEFDDSAIHGAVTEGHANGTKIGQFTNQESILTLQDYVNMRERNE